MDNNDRTEQSDNTAPFEAGKQADAIAATQNTQSDEIIPSDNGRLSVSPPDPEIEVPEAPAQVEETIVGSEIEPSTEAFQPEQQTPSSTVPIKTPAPLESHSSPETSIVTPAPATTMMKDKRRLLFIAAGVGLLVIIAACAAWLLLGGKKNDNQTQVSNTSSVEIEQPKLGVILTVADGTVEFSTDNTSWATLTTSSQLEEGMLVRTGEQARAVLTLDDGSAIRLDSNTTAKLTSLASDDVRIEQTLGSIYSRVVPSDRKYTVSIDDSTYQALGTAFVTTKNSENSGVQVYQSSVKTSDAEEAVTEGKQFYKENSNPDLKGKVTALDIDTLTEDAFVTWNMSQDEGDANFKEKLGVLAQIKERSIEIDKLKQAKEALAASEMQRGIEERAAKLKQEIEEKEKQASSGKVTRGQMTLSESSKIFSWNYSGNAVHGYKLVYSKHNTMPTFGTDDAIYFGSSSDKSGSIPGKNKIGSGKYYVRVCAYTANTESDGCVDYSNTVTIQQ